MIVLRHKLFDEARCARAIELARLFFELPHEAKQALAIEKSPHFRGYSEMRNERDWREQIHFGPERAPSATWQLEGPNQWPSDNLWRTELLAVMRDLEAVGRKVLEDLAPGVLASDEDPYTLLKLIRYHASPAEDRPGVAAHVDFSWITLLIQDDDADSRSKLEVKVDSQWHPVPPDPGTLVVNFGELLEFATGGKYRATPHRVRAGGRSRISMPFFLCPSLSTTVKSNRESHPEVQTETAEHVHQVLDPMSPKPFVFGEAEWHRKGLGRWCARCG